MTPPERCPNQDPFSPRPSSNSTLLLSSSSRPLIFFLKFNPYSFPQKLSKPSSASRRPKKSFPQRASQKKKKSFFLYPFFIFSLSQLLSYSPVSQHGLPNHPLQLHASCRRPPALSWGSPTSTVCSFPNPLYRCRILIAPQSTNLIPCQPLQRRHVVSRDRATSPNNLHER